jgi:hypothetical protein
VSEQLYEFTHDYPFRTPLPDLQPQNATSVAYAASIVALSGRGRCFGFQGYNSGAAQFVLVFDRGSLPGDGAAPVIVIPAGATSSFSAYFGSAGRWFDRGIVLCNSSTGPTKTIGGADCWFDVQFAAGDQG